MVECASILSRNVTYEIPALKRLVTKSEQLQGECRKKDAANRKQAQEYRDKFLHSCSQLGLNFDHFDFKSPDQKPPSLAAIGNQVVALMNLELPEIFHRVTLKSRDVKGAMEFYYRFLKSTIGLGDAELKDCLALLRLVIGKVIVMSIS